MTGNDQEKSFGLRDAPVGCTARQGMLSCDREAWHPGGHSQGGAYFFEPLDTLGQAEIFAARIEIEELAP